MIHLEQLRDGTELHRLQEMDQLLSHLRYAGVVAQTPEERRLDRRVPGVQLPGMDVDDSMSPIPLQTTKKRICQLERISAKISSAPERYPERANRSDG